MEDADYMQRALELAQAAAKLGEVPVGAVAVHAGTVVGTGFNRREIDRDPLGHAELLALSQAAASLQSWRLTGVTLYVTLEPCAMCAGAMVQSRLSRLVYGAADPKAGAAGSVYNLLEDPRYNHQVEVTRAVLADECGRLLVDFFRALRSADLKTE
jgi:tRNA(adenine34) deaminase